MGAGKYSPKTIDSGPLSLNPDPKLWTLSPEVTINVDPEPTPDNKLAALFISID